jgi:hypothetical protein
MAGFDPKKVTTLEWVVIGAGGLAFIDSFLPWYTASVSFSGISRSSSTGAWGAGFAAWFSVLLLLAAGGLVLATAMGVEMKLPVPWPVITLGLSALAFVLILLRWLTCPNVDSGLGGLGEGFKASSGAGFGLFIGLICAVAVGVASFLTFRAAGGDFRQLRQRPGSTPPVA